MSDIIYGITDENGDGSIKVMRLRAADADNDSIYTIDVVDEMAALKLWRELNEVLSRRFAQRLKPSLTGASHDDGSD